MLQTNTGIYHYLAPEVWHYVDTINAESGVYTNAVDIWFFGCVVYQMLARQVTLPTISSKSEDILCWRSISRETVRWSYKQRRDWIHQVHLNPKSEASPLSLGSYGRLMASGRESGTCEFINFQETYVDSPEANISTLKSAGFQLSGKYIRSGRFFCIPSTKKILYAHEQGFWSEVVHISHDVSWIKPIRHRTHCLYCLFQQKLSKPEISIQECGSYRKPRDETRSRRN